MDADVLPAVVAVVVAASFAAAVATIDQRALRATSSNAATFPSTTFEQAMKDPSSSWFRKKLRCDKASFLRIYALVAQACHPKPAPNAKHKLIKRLALTMLYLAQGGTEDHAATTLGIPRSRAVDYINEILRILCTLGERYVRMPSHEELPAVEAGFFRIAGFPGVVGAIDGTLIRIPRPADYEGWYSSKNFPALNVQAVVDSTGMFRSLSIRAGLTNDQSLWNGSGLRKRLSEYVPVGKHLIGDAGYKIWRHLLVPYPEGEAALDPQKARLKNRFRILLGKVEMKTTDHRCKVIQGCVVLHNLLLLLKDSCVTSGEDPYLSAVHDAAEDDPIGIELPISHLQGKAKRDDLAEIFAGRVDF